MAGQQCVFGRVDPTALVEDAPHGELLDPEPALLALELDVAIPQPLGRVAPELGELGVEIERMFAYYRYDARGV